MFWILVSVCWREKIGEEGLCRFARIAEVPEWLWEGDINFFEAAVGYVFNGFKYSSGESGLE